MNISTVHKNECVVLYVIVVVATSLHHTHANHHEQQTHDGTANDGPHIHIQTSNLIIVL